jgi:hypothetical protein
MARDFFWPPMLQALMYTVGNDDSTYQIGPVITLSEQDVVLDSVLFTPLVAGKTFAKLSASDACFLGDEDTSHDYSEQRRSVGALANSLRSSSLATEECMMQIGQVTRLYAVRCPMCLQFCLENTDSFRDEYGILCVLTPDAPRLHRRGRSVRTPCSTQIGRKAWVDLNIDDIRAQIPGLLFLGDEERNQGRWPILFIVDYVWKLADAFRDHLSLKALCRKLFRSHVRHAHACVGAVRDAGFARITFGDVAWLLGKVPSTTWLRRVLVNLHVVFLAPLCRKCGPRPRVGR